MMNKQDFSKVLKETEGILLILSVANFLVGTRIIGLFGLIAVGGVIILLYWNSRRKE